MEAERRPLRHQHSESSDIGRAAVPMWDSSDPERAPPPLPLNPQSPVAGLTSRAGTSAAIQSAHAALSERAREHAALVPSALVRRIHDVSPERSPTRPAREANSSHRRTQTMQNGSVRDLSLQIEGYNGSGSPTKSHQQHQQQQQYQQYQQQLQQQQQLQHQQNQQPHQQQGTYATPTKHNKDSLDYPRSAERDAKGVSITDPSTPILRPGPTVTGRRSHHQSILGENTPPQSATMLALQNMAPASQPREQPVESPLSNVTNGATMSTAPVPIRGPQSIESLSAQMLALTGIATAVQKEMSQLTRRSRDNATDLLTLKEATNARDEDIRRSLRDLLTTFHDASARSSTRDPFGAGLYIDSKPHHHAASPHSAKSATAAARPFSLPRIPSPNSFAASLDREDMSTPSLCGAEFQPIVAVLDKVVRDMGTRESQDEITQHLADILQRISATATASRLDEVAELVRNRLDGAVVPLREALREAATGDGSGGGGGGKGRPSTAPDFDDEDPHSRRITFEDINITPAKPSDILGDDLVKVIRSIKDSVAQSGGLTAEVKALVRELRGEILGMGREIGRKLDLVGSGSGSGAGVGSGSGPAGGSGGGDGDAVESADVDPSAPSSSGATKNDRDEVAQIIDEGLGKMKDQLNNILREHRRQSAQSTRTPAAAVIDYQEIYTAMRNALKDSPAPPPQLSREDVVSAVRDAWESYRPELEPRGGVGLERDEILACLKEGLEEGGRAAASRDEVFDAMVEALKTFVPPRVDTPASLSRDEILEAVRECLEEFEFPVAPSAMNADLTRDDMLHAVKEGLSGFEISGSLMPAAAHEEAVTRLRELIEAMRDELKAVSDEIKKQTGAGGTGSASSDGAAASEAALTATRDGIEKLRSDLATCVTDRSSGPDEFMSGVVKTLDAFKVELVEVVSRMTSDSKALIEGQIDNFREILASSVVPTSGGGLCGIHAGRDEALIAVRDGLDALRSDIRQSTGGTPRALDNVRETLNDLRISIDELTRRSRLQDPNDPVMEEVRSNLIEVQADLKAMREEQQQRPENTIVPVSSPSTISAAAAGECEEGERSADDEKAVVAVGDTGTDIDTDTDTAATAPTDTTTTTDTTATATPTETSAATLRPEDIKSLEVTIAQLRTQVEALERPASTQATTEGTPGSSGSVALKEDVVARVEAMLGSAIRREDLGRIEEVLRGAASREDVCRVEEILRGGLSKEDLDRVETLIRTLQQSLDVLAARGEILPGTTAQMAPSAPAPDATVQEKTASPASPSRPANFDDAATKEDIEAVETILRNAKARLDDLMDGEQAVRKDHVDAVEAAVQKVGDAIDTVRAGLGPVSKREQVAAVEALVRGVIATLAEMKDVAARQLEDPARITKADTDALAAACAEIRGRLDRADLAEVSTREDVRGVEALIRDAKEMLEAQQAADATAIVERHAETASLGERVGAVGALLREVRDALSEKLQDGALSVNALGETMARLGAALEQQGSTVGLDVREVLDRLKAEFDDTRAGLVEVKLEADQRLTDTVETLGGRIDNRVAEVAARLDGMTAAMDERHRAGQVHDAVADAAVRDTKAVAEDLRQIIDTLGSTVTDSLEKMEVASKTVFTRVEDMPTRAEGHADHEQTRDRVGETLSAVEALRGTVADTYYPQLLQAVAGVLAAVGEHSAHGKASAVDLAEAVVRARYDDSAVRETLDRLLADHGQSAAAALARLEALDDAVKATSGLLAQQAVRIEDEREDRQRILNETNAALETRLGQKYEVESTLGRLRDEEERLRRRVDDLRGDEQYLNRQKMRLTADVSSLETALQLRREELREMEGRAEGLERRILEGAMNHSRLLLLGKKGGNGSSAPDAAMNRKRVKSTRVGGGDDDARRGGISMVLAARRGALGSEAAGASPARRIVSLGQMSHNAGLGIKRSQSVRMAARGDGTGLRKGSWGGSFAASAAADDDKENAPVDMPSMPEHDISDGEGVPEHEPDYKSAREPDHEPEEPSVRRCSGMTTVINDAEGGGDEYDGGERLDDDDDDDHDDDVHGVEDEYTEVAGGDTGADAVGPASDDGSIVEVTHEGGEVEVEGGE